MSDPELASTSGRPSWAALAALCCVGLAAIWFAVHAKPAVRAYQDSVIYLEGARQLAAGQGFATAQVPLHATEPAPITAYAPGFSWMMVPFVWLGMDVREGAAAVLGLAYIGYALSTFLLVLAATRPSWWPAAAVFTGVLILQPTVLQYLPSILSDLPFAALTTTVAWLAVRWVRAQRPALLSALLLGGCLGLATLTRWSGMQLGIVLALGILLALPATLSLGRRLGLVAAVAAAALATVAPWLLRNRVLGGSLTGDRFITLHDPMNVAGHALAGLTSGLSDMHALLADAPLATGAYDASVLLAACFLVGVLIRGRAWRVRHTRLLAVVAFGYVALLLGTAFVHIIDSLVAPRYWLPVWPVLGALGLGAFAGSDVTRRTRTGLCVALLLPAAASGVAFNRHRIYLARPDVEVERFFLDEKLAHSAPVSYVRSKGRDCTVVSNFALPLTLHARPRLVYPVPMDADTLRVFLEAEGRVCIAYLYRRDVYRKHPELDPVGTLEALAAEGRIRLIQRDGFGEIWLPVSAAND